MTDLTPEKRVDLRALAKAEREAEACETCGHPAAWHHPGCTAPGHIIPGADCPCWAYVAPTPYQREMRADR